jgi:hypothetical protein
LLTNKPEKNKQISPKINGIQKVIGILYLLKELPGSVVQNCQTCCWTPTTLSPSLFCAVKDLNNVPFLNQLN